MINKEQPMRKKKKKRNRLVGERGKEGKLDRGSFHKFHIQH